MKAEAASFLERFFLDYPTYVYMYIYIYIYIYIQNTNSFNIKTESSVKITK